ncbi:MAG: alkaline phosphatase family protein, partial [Anaerolineae bacterium]
NPFTTAPMPALRSLIGGPLVAGREIDEPGLLLKPIDATLGVAGLPQSATGQTAVFTGVNGAALIGKHLSAWPTDPLIGIIERDNILKWAAEHGHSPTFANAYSPAYFERVRRNRRRHSVTTLCTLSAGLPLRDVADLLRGQAVYWDITHHALRERYQIDVPLRDSGEAGRNLARLSTDHEFVVFESFLTDVAGHRYGQVNAADVLKTVDKFLAGVLANIAPDVTLLITSDHGNIEDLSTKEHTRNPVPLLAIGPHGERFREARAITDVAEIIRATLSA